MRVHEALPKFGEMWEAETSMKNQNCISRMALLGGNHLQRVLSLVGEGPTDPPLIETLRHRLWSCFSSWGLFTFTNPSEPSWSMVHFSLRVKNMLSFTPSHFGKQKKKKKNEAIISFFGSKSICCVSVLCLLQIIATIYEAFISGMYLPLSSVFCEL